MCGTLPVYEVLLHGIRNHTSHFILIYIGNSLYKSKQFTEALTAYDEAYALDKTNVMVMNNKAAVYIEMGEVDSAIAACNEVLEKVGLVCDRYVYDHDWNGNVQYVWC
ncbi:tetratricopeptide repeat protein [archaeon]|nr:MAG: tetratricopeptide repeat protein [archaeon]